MSVEIREAKSRTERKAWVKFVFSHYRDHRFYVPDSVSIARLWAWIDGIGGARSLPGLTAVRSPSQAKV